MIRVDGVQIEGERATVTFGHPTFGRDPDDDFFLLVNVDGRWLIDSFPDDEDDDDIPPWAVEKLTEALERLRGSEPT
jgi:hypothetical protein